MNRDSASGFMDINESDWAQSGSGLNESDWQALAESFP